MIEKKAETTLGRWAAPEIALSIEYRPEVMEEIRSTACESQRQFSNGGLDVGGVLFGTHLDNFVRIVTWRPIFSEHAEGPELRLSAEDRRGLVRQLLAAKQDPELQWLQPVGWFLSHMRSGIALSAADLEIFDGYFGEPWQVTLVLLPAAEGTARAGFFAREAGGKLRSESSYKEFTIEPPSARPPSGRPPKAKYLRWLWAIPTLIAMILAGLLIKPPHPEPVNPGIFLRIQDAQINWDANSSTVRGAKRAEIDIQDGGRLSHFQLAGVELASGRMAWQHHSGEVQVRMTLYPASGGAVRESARLLISTVTVPASPAPDTHAEELKKLNEELHQERARSEKLQNMVKILENRLEIDTARGKTEPRP